VGFNVPDVDCVALLRPTMSKRLYYQQVGRGMRIHPSKADCLILDFAGNAKAHGPVNRLSMKVKSDCLVADLGIKQAKSDEDAVRVCPECRTANELDAVECVECGNVLRRTREFKHEGQADTQAVIVDMDKPSDGYELVKCVEFAVHTPRDESRPDCVRIIYHLDCGDEISEWKFPEGQRTEPFRQWWNANARPPVPLNATEAVDRLTHGGMKFPSHIRVNRKGKYPDIVGRRWNGPAPQVMRLGIV
jgi:DNA repair protein RadD